MLNVLIDTSPLANANAHRGIGAYTRWLTTELEKKRDLNLLKSSQELPKGTKLDVVHYPFFDFFFDTLPLRKKAATVVTIHDVIPLVFPKQYPPGKRGKLRLFKQSLALKSVKAIITDSEASKTDIHKYFKIDESRIHVIPLAANPELQPAKPSQIQAVRSELSLPESYILYVGDINYNKNIPQLIKSLKFLPDTVHLVCVGQNFYPHDIPEWQWIETQVALSNVEDRVHFVTQIGSQASQTLSALYSGAVAYVQPSLYEGFGLPLLEAMQCKTPVVSTKVASLPEVGGEYAVYTEPEAESLAQGVTEVLDWSQNRRQLQIKAAFDWSQRFTWKKTANETIRVYQSVANSG
jgi:glycosyltransferase involved in cell wall biosynthesis